MSESKPAKNPLPRWLRRCARVLVTPIECGEYLWARRETLGYVFWGTLVVLMVLVWTTAALWNAFTWPEDETAESADEPPTAIPQRADDLPAPPNLPPSPLDALDRTAIPPSALRPGLPQEVVAVVGSWQGEQHLAGVDVMTASRDGRVAAGGQLSTFVTLHDARPLRLREALQCPEGLLRLAFSPDSQVLAAGGVGWLAAWHTNKEVPARLIDLVHWDGVTTLCVAVSADGQWLAAGGGWCKMEPRPRGTAEQEDLHRQHPLLATPNEEFHGGWLGVWRVDGDGLTPWLRVMDRSRAVTTLAFDGDVKRLVSGEEGGTVAVWRVPAEAQDRSIPREKLWWRWWLGTTLTAGFLAIVCLLTFFLKNSDDLPPDGSGRWRRKVVTSARVAGAVFAVVAIVGIVVLICTGNSNPETVRPMREVRGCPAESLVFTGETVVWCGPGEGALHYRLHGSARRTGSLQAYRWDLSGWGVSTPFLEVVGAPSGIAVLVGALVGSLLPWLIVARLLPGEFLEAKFVPVSGSVSCFIVGSAALICLGGVWSLIPAGLAWLCWYAFAVGVTLSCVLGWRVASRHPDRQVSRWRAGVGWSVTLMLLAGPTYWLMLPSGALPRLAIDATDYTLRCTAFSPDGKIILAVVEELEEDQPRSLRLDPPKQWVETWDVAAGEKTTSAPVRGGFIDRLELAADGALLMEGHPVVARFAPEQWLAALTLPHGPGSRSVCFLGSDTIVIADASSLRLVNLLSGKEEKLSVDPPGPLTDLVASDDGKVVAAILWPSSGDPCQLCLWVLPQQKPRMLLVAGPTINFLALSADGRRLAAISEHFEDLNNRKSWVQVLDVTSGEEIAQREKAFHALAVSPDGKAVVYGQGGRLVVWDLSDKQPTELTRPPISLRGAGLGFTSDGRRLLLARWNHRDWEEEFVLKEHAPTDEPQQGHQWDYPDLKRGSPFHVGGQSPVVSPDGRLVASVMRNRFLLLEECATNKRFVRRMPAISANSRVAFAPDGRHLAVPLYDGTVIVMRLHDAERQRILAACETVLERQPRDTTALVQRGELRLESGQLDQALADARAVLAVDLRHRGALHLLGLARARNKEPAEAIEAFDKLISMDGKDALAFYRRGLARTDKGDVAGARSDLEYALKLDPSLAAPSR